MSCFTKSPETWTKKDLQRARSLARLSPATLARLVNRRFQRPQHLAYLDRQLTAVAHGELRRLIVSMPPRYGKSMLCSHYFPAWFLLTQPSKAVILASYEATFATSWGRKARETVAEWGPRLFGVKLSDVSSSAGWWNLAGHEGSMMTAGVGGPLTGKGADLLLLDDPIKNDSEAMSPTYRQQLWEWYDSVASTRLEPGGSVILIMTRWHEDDLAGRLLTRMAEGGEHWEYVRFPVLAEEADVLGRAEGEPLWPARFPLEDVQEQQRNRSVYWWNALYQQRPGPAGGSVFKREDFRYFRVNEEADTYRLIKDSTIEEVAIKHCRIFCTADTASTLKQRSDWTVIGVWAVTPKGDLLLLDLYRVKLEDPDQVGLFRSVYERYKPAFIGVEGSVYQQLVRSRLPVKALEPDRDKWSRAQPASARMKAGTIFFKLGASWLSAVEDELLTFPNAAHDDIVDVVAYAALEIVGYSGGMKVWV